MKQVLVVDENLDNLKQISAQLVGEYRVTLAKSGAQALEMLSTHVPDLVLMETDMREMNGFEALERIRGRFGARRIPIVVLTQNRERAAEARALSCGATDFIATPFERKILLHRIEMHLRYASYQAQLEGTVKTLSDSVAISFSELIECRDQSTGGHVQRTGRYLLLLGQELCRLGDRYEKELSGGELELMARAAPMHDIGKIGISDSILLKPGRLTADEFGIMKRHAQIGADIMTALQRRMPTQRYLRYARIIAATHHERFDGKGYPHALAGEGIPLCGRLMALADVYDAMISDRVYRPAMSHQVVNAIIENSAGGHFDPVVVQAYCNVRARFEEIAASAQAAPTSPQGGAR